MKTLYESITQSVAESVLDVDDNIKKYSSEDWLRIQKILEYKPYDTHISDSLEEWPHSQKEFDALVDYFHAKGRGSSSKTSLEYTLKQYENCMELDRVFHTLTISAKRRPIKIQYICPKKAMNFSYSKDTMWHGKVIIHNPLHIGADGKQILFLICGEGRGSTLRPLEFVVGDDKHIQYEFNSNIKWYKDLRDNIDNIAIHTVKTMEEATQYIMYKYSWI